MRELKGIEEKILDRALYLFGKNGSSNVPIRAISKEAGVNVSAINYYFGSKDEMVRNVQDFYIENMVSAYSELANKNISDEEKLILCGNEIMEYALRYPGIFVMQKEASNAGEEDEMAKKIVDVTNSMNKKLDEVLKKVIKSSKNEFGYAKMMFLSSIIYPTNDFSKSDLDNGAISEKEGRIKYIEYILNKLKENK